MQSSTMVRFLTKCIKESTSLESVKAYVNALEFVLDQGDMVSIKLAAVLSTHTMTSKIGIIKEIRGLFGTGLREAKDMVEQGHVFQNLDAKTADALRTRLTPFGARLETV